VLEPYRSKLEKECEKYKVELFLYEDPIFPELEDYEIDLAKLHAEMKLDIAKEIYKEHYEREPPVRRF